MPPKTAKLYRLFTKTFSAYTRWYVLGFIFFLSSIGPAVASHGARPVVLFLSSYHKNLPALQAIELGLKQSLGMGGTLDGVYFEFLDSQRFPNQESADALRTLILTKYQSIRFDAIVAWGTSAATFAKTLRADLGDPRLILAEVSPGNLRIQNVQPADADNVLVDARQYYEDSLREAVRLSRPERLFVIGETTSPAGARRLSSFKASLSSLDLGIPVELMVDQPLDEIVTKVSQLPPRSIIFYLLLFSDGRGHPLTPFEAARPIAAAASVPLFSAWDSLMGSGTVGGHLLSLEVLGQQIGQTIVDLNHGLAPNPPGKAMRYVYDWAQIQRWGWTGFEFPAEATFFNRPVSPWTLYRRQIFLAVAVIVALGGLSAILARALRSRNEAMALLAEERASLADRVRERTAELSLTAQKLERSNTELEQFAYAASHDLRQPLRLINNYLALIQRRHGSALTEEAGNFITSATDCAKRMDAMISGLLDYSRLGHTETPACPTNLDAAIDEALSNLLVSRQESAAQITFGRGLPDILGHSSELVRLFQNLVGNAIKYIEPGQQPQINITWSRQDENVTVQVADRGIGIPPDQRERVFGVFQRLVSNDHYEGSGIGLALCRKIVEHHKGRLWIEDNPGGGSIFLLALPVWKVSP